MSTLGLQRGIVRLELYNPEWSRWFEQEKQLLLDTFNDRIVAIEHIGSTAIPGLPAKPIIDINVAVPDLNDIGDFITALPELGYEYSPERRFPDRQFFSKGVPERITHHLNLTEQGSETAWNNALLFRDYLREHEEAKEEYARLKHRLAEEYADNRDSYTEEKSTFVRNIIERAKR